MVIDDKQFSALQQAAKQAGMVLAAEQIYDAGNYLGNNQGSVEKTITQYANIYGLRREM